MHSNENYKLDQFDRNVGSKIFFPYTKKENYTGCLVLMSIVWNDYYW